MKSNRYQALFLFGILLLCSSSKHPIKLTASLLEYDPGSKSISIECRVFIDDFENTLGLENFDASNISKKHQSDIEYYFLEFYRISVNGQEFTLNYSSSEALEANNVLNLKFLVNDVSLQEGDELIIENSLFFMEFGEKQTNRMIIRFPPFIPEVNYIATIDNPLVSYKL
ncbi:MAG: DUF6702 family protein [Bacteroidota bacterium]